LTWLKKGRQRSATQVGESKQEYPMLLFIYKKKKKKKKKCFYSIFLSFYFTCSSPRFVLLKWCQYLIQETYASFSVCTNAIIGRLAYILFLSKAGLIFEWKTIKRHNLSAWWDLFWNLKYQKNNIIITKVRKRRDKEFTNDLMLDIYAYHYELVLMIILFVLVNLFVYIT